MKDISFDETGDLVLTWIQGPPVLLGIVDRRLGTLPVEYARVVRTSSGTEELDIDYGSSLPQYVSYPSTSLNQPLISQIVSNALANEPAINFTSVNLTTSPTSTTASIQVLFTAVNSQDILTTTV